MRPIDADELKNTLDKIKIVIDEGILECNTIHETLVYLLGKVEAVVNEAIDEQPTIEPETETMKRMLAKLEQKASLCSLRDRDCVFAVRLDRVIAIVKAEFEKEEP